jgi:hypothetical protein
LRVMLRVPRRLQERLQRFISIFQKRSIGYNHWNDKVTCAW